MGIRFGPLPPSFNNTYSLALDGVDDYVSVPNLSISGASPRTMTCWFKTTSSVNQNIMGFGTTSNGSYFALTLYNSGGFKLFGHTWNLGAGGDLFGPVVSLNDWHFAVLTYDGVTLKISLDGSTFATTTATLNTTNTPFLIGDSAYTGWSNFTGDIDEVAIWDYALTQTEINAIYNSGAPNDLTSLNTVAWYRNGDNGTWKSPQWLIPNNENKTKFSNYSFEFDGVNDYINCGTDSSLKPTSAYSISGSLPTKY